MSSGGVQADAVGVWSPGRWAARSSSRALLRLDRTQRRAPSVQAVLPVCVPGGGAGSGKETEGPGQLHTCGQAVRWARDTCPRVPWLLLRIR